VKKLAVGFALAVQPICAQTAITTDATGLTAGEVKIPVPGRSDPRLSSLSRQGPGVPDRVVVQEIFGVHESYQGPVPPPGPLRLLRGGAGDVLRARATFRR